MLRAVTKELADDLEISVKIVLEKIKNKFLGALIVVAKICRLAAFASLFTLLALDQEPALAQTLPRSGNNLLITQTIPVCYSTFSCQGSNIGWTLAGTTQDCTTAQGAGCSIKLTSVGGYLASNAIWPITPATTYTFSLYQKSDNSSPQALPMVIVQAYKNSNWQFSRNISFEIQSVNQLAGGWQEIAVTFQTNPGENYVGFKIEMSAKDKDATTPSSFWISNAYLGQGIGFDHAASEKSAFNGSKVKISSSGNISLFQNNQWAPFFPICIYANNNRSDWSVYKTHGFNCNMWAWDSNEVRKAQQAGLYSGYQIARFISPSNSSYNQISTLQSDVDIINADQSLSNSLLYYYWDNENDELPEWNVPAQVAETINAHDRDSYNARMHPLYMLQGNVGLARKYNSAGAVSGTTDASGNIQSLSDSVGTYVSQDSITPDGATNYTKTFGQLILNNIEQQRQPVSVAVFNGDPTGGKYSGSQFKAAVYTAIANGAKGIAYWKDCDNPCNVPGVLPIENTAWWTQLPALAAVIQSQLPIIQSEAEANWGLLKTSSGDNVQAGARTYLGVAYVIAANENSNSASPTFSFRNLNYSPSVVINSVTRDSVASISDSIFTLPLQANDGGFYLLGDNVPDSLALNLVFNGNLNDKSPANNSNGALIGSSSGASLVNNTLVLNGGYVQIPSQVSAPTPASLSLEMSNNLTIVARANIDSSQTGYAAIVTKGAGDSNTAGYAFFYDANNSRLNFWYGAGGSGSGDRNTVSANVPSLKGAWHTVAVSATLAGVVTFYVDGTAYAGSGTVHSESPNTIVNSAQPMQIGAWYSGNYLKGTLDNVRVYKSALTVQEMAALTANVLQLGVQNIVGNPSNDLSLIGNDIASSSFGWNANSTSSAMIGYQPTVSGAPIFVSSAGGIQNNLEFDSSADWSLSARVQMNNANNSSVGIITKGAAGPTTAGYALIYNTVSQQLGFWPCCSGSGLDQRGYFNSSPININDGAVHDIVVTFSRSLATVDFYVDGVSVGQPITVPSGFTNADFTNTATNVQIGSWAYGNYLNGEVGNIFVDRRVITPAEIQQRKNISK